MIALILAASISAPNVVFISVDTLRADHLGFYGHPVPASPNLDRLAADSLVFDDTVCEIPLTGPSFAAMMTSRFPRAVGVTRNGIRLPEDVPTAAELFAAAGYETVCVTSNWTLKAKLSGLDRGFEAYDDGFRKRRWIILKTERDAGEVSDLAIRTLQSRDPSRPLFAWFHYSDPHAPYTLRDGFEVSTLADYPGDPGAAEKVRYDSEIAYTDAQIQRVLDALPPDPTFVVFAGDHGESLREHGYLGHGRRIYQNNLRIPFLVHGPGVTPGRNAAPARGIDVAPTLLSLAGLDPAPGMAGEALLRQQPGLERLRVVETYGGAVFNLPGAKEIMESAGPDWQAVVFEGWKLIEGHNDTELYYLPDDPDELVNLAAGNRERVTRLRRIIDSWTAAVTPAGANAAELSGEDVQALRSLGYVD
jgi:arylsulfatase A-like enzyme